MKITGFQRQSDNASNKRHSSIYEIIAIAYSNFFKRIKKKVLAINEKRRIDNCPTCTKPFSGTRYGFSPHVIKAQLWAQWFRHLIYTAVKA